MITFRFMFCSLCVVRSLFFLWPVVCTPWKAKHSLISSQPTGLLYPTHENAPFHTVYKLQPAIMRVHRTEHPHLPPCTE